MYDTCERHSDWYYGHFCEAGRWVEEVGVSHYCTSHEACGRSGFCLYSNTNYEFGYWVDYATLTVASNTQVLAHDGTDYLYQQNAEKVCEYGWIDFTTGQWSEPVLSLNSGEACTTDLQWPTNVTGTYAPCKCSLDGTQKCDVMGANGIWVDAFIKFKKYLNATESYHSAEILGEWMKTPEYYDWYCAEFEAENYVSLLTKPSWFDSVMQTYDEYATYYKTCIESAYEVSILPVIISFVIIFSL